MLSRIYIDNYKSLVNFDFEPGPVRLILGPNGSGKSSVFDAVLDLKDMLVTGMDIEDCFGGHTLTRWDNRATQVVELTVDGNGGRYVYRVEVEHLRTKDVVRVALEDLSFEGQFLYSFRRGDVRLFRDDYSAGPQFPSDTRRSGLFSVPPRHDNTKLSWFKSWAMSLCCVRVDPNFSASSSGEEENLYDTMENFASWYRHLSQENHTLVHEWFEALRDGVIEGFDSMGTASNGASSRFLYVDLNVASDEGGGTKRIRFDFEELSHGQRVLIMLYGLAYCALRPDTTLFIDDPVLHVALAEVQPWLTTLLDRADNVGAQVLLISHHPELINYLAREKGVYLERDRNGPVRIKATRLGEETGLPPAELIARGWEA